MSMMVFMIKMLKKNNRRLNVEMALKSPEGGIARSIAESYGKD